MQTALNAPNHYLTVYKKDYVKRPTKRTEVPPHDQEFKDPICEGFKAYLTLDESHVEKPLEDGDRYLNKIKVEKKKVAKIYFQEPLDHVTIKGNKMLEGKSTYQVEYCNIESEIRRKLLEKAEEKPKLPNGWIIPITTQKTDYRSPRILSKRPLKKTLELKPINNLGQNEKVNDILNVTTGESEYSDVIGKWGEFIVKEQMHGKIVHPKCTCAKHNFVNM